MFSDLLMDYNCKFLLAFLKFDPQPLALLTPPLFCPQDTEEMLVETGNDIT